jgi:hypothetical protein
MALIWSGAGVLITNVISPSGQQRVVHRFGKGGIYQGKAEGRRTGQCCKCTAHDVSSHKHPLPQVSSMVFASS